MIRTAAFLSGVVCLALSTATRGDENKSTAYEHLKPLQWQIGDWVGEYTAAFDLAGVKKGDVVTSHTSFRWMLDRSVLVVDSHQVVGGKRIPNTHEIASWDPTSNKRIVRFYTAQGAGCGEYAQIGDKIVLPWSADLEEGKLKGTSYIEKVDADTYTWQGREVTLAGKKLPDWPVVTMRRKTGAAPGELWNNFRDAAKGKWKGTGELLRDGEVPDLAKGTKFEIDFLFEPVADGMAMTGRFDFRIPGKDVAATAPFLAGWDPQTEQIAIRDFWSIGGLEEVFLSRQKGKQFFGTYAGKSPGAAPLKGRIRWRYHDADSYDLTFLDGPYKGQVLSSWKRVHPAASAAASVSPESQAAIERLVGVWSIEGKHGDATVRGTLSTDWAPGKHCLVSQVDGKLMGEAVALSAVVGCDPLTGEILDFGFVSGTNYRCFHWSVKEANRWEGRMRGVVDGNRIDVPCVMEWSGPNGYTSTIAAGVPENVYHIKKSLVAGE